MCLRGAVVQKLLADNKPSCGYYYCAVCVRMYKWGMWKLSSVLMSSVILVEKVASCKSALWIKPFYIKSVYNTKNIDIFLIKT